LHQQLKLFQLRLQNGQLLWLHLRQIKQVKEAVHTALNVLCTLYADSTQQQIRPCFYEYAGHRIPRIQHLWPLFSLSPHQA